MKKFLLVLMMVFVTISTSFAKGLGYVKPLKEACGWSPVYDNPLRWFDYNAEKDTKCYYTKELIKILGAKNGFKFVSHEIPECGLDEKVDDYIHDYVMWFKTTSGGEDEAKNYEGWLGGTLTFQLYAYDENKNLIKYPEIVIVTFIYNIYSDDFKKAIRCYTY